ncbi:site-specific recombinase XerD [Microbacterium sp. AG1240]|uniref:tyrosine-type recombinase/integrase n=1 Tax=Microbacterium sp. AG1240 TaxID=2183992 RepID=UPI000EADFCEB|nr:tyrosine-type recombinase/integrase [Microbacterium sp. AG1240]RKT33640.1 site-specific recombinase XerD [Microbacterium sp. AG1240]
MLDRRWLRAIDGYLLDQKAGGKPDTTLRARRDQLQHLARRVEAGPYELTFDQLRDMVSSQEWKQETRRVRRSTYKSFYDWAVAEGHVTENIADRLPKVRMSQGRPKPAPDRIYKEAIMAAAPRERLMLRLAADVGMRRAEVAKVHTNDLMEEGDGWSLLIHGKGNKERIVPVPIALAETILAMPSGFLFPGRDEGHLTPRFVGKQMAAILPEEWTAHTLRHRFATRAYAATHDLLLVQHMLGHSSPATTRRYIEYGRSEMRSVVERLSTEGIAA